ncbi:MAG: hypothetical protein ACYDHB_14555 [Candidatus Dormibacteria bacterium]
MIKVANVERIRWAHFRDGLSIRAGDHRNSPLSIIEIPQAHELPQGWPDPEDLQTQVKSILAAAANVARQLPPPLRVHLNPERLLDVALGSVITTDLPT